MRFKDVFSIIGPAMIGPSSSHTAGAVRLGRVTRGLLGETPSEAVITLYGSFAETYLGHGTDLALIGGLLDFAPDDLRIPDALALAEAQGLSVRFKRGAGAAHPNTALIELASHGRAVAVKGTSIGGGNIEIVGVDGFDVKFSGQYPTLVLRHRDRPGFIAAVSGALSQAGMNIGYMVVDRKARSGDALTVMETDGRLSQRLLDCLTISPDVREARFVDLGEGSSSEIPDAEGTGGIGRERRQDDRSSDGR